MKNNIRFILVLSFTSLLLQNCSKTPEVIKPRLLISLKDEAGNSIPGATVRLYKNAGDPGITQLSDTTGIVIFSNLDEALYYWLAEKGCKTNRNSQTTLNRVLISDVILYGNSILSETGTLMITNNSPEPYKVSDSVFNITLVRDTPYITYPKIGSYLIHSEKVSTPGVGKDTLVMIACSDTVFINLPY